MSDYYVYILGHETNGRVAGPVKIGIAGNPGARVSELQTGNPTKLRMVHIFAAPSRKAAREIETVFHAVMAPERLTGEWFDLAPIVAVSRMVQFLRFDADINGTDESVMAEMGVVSAEKLLARMVSNGPGVLQ